MISNRSRKIPVPLGRPRGQQQINQTEGIDDKIWFFNDYLVKITTFLATQGSLIFKSECGQKSDEKIKQLRSQKIQESDIKSIKQYRKELLHALQEYQSNILEQLGYPKDTLYMLIGNGKQQENIFNNQKKTLNLILEILDQRFIKSFECFVNMEVIDLSEEKHKMLLDWGTIMVLTKQGRDLWDSFKKIYKLIDIIEIRQKVDIYIKQIKETFKKETQINLDNELLQKQVDAFLENFYAQICDHL